MLYVFASKMWWPNKESRRRNSPSTHTYPSMAQSYITTRWWFPGFPCSTQTNNYVKIKELERSLDKRQRCLCRPFHLDEFLGQKFLDPLEISHSFKRWGRKEGDQRQKSGGNNAVWRTGLSKEKPLKVACMWILRSWKKIWSLLKNKKRVNIREISDCW